MRRTPLGHNVTFTSDAVGCDLVHVRSQKESGGSAAMAMNPGMVTWRLLAMARRFFGGIAAGDNVQDWCK